MTDLYTVLAILMMALTTFFTRVIGYLLLKDKILNIRLTKVLEATPGCVIISVIAPAFATTQPANLIALAISILAASRLSLLATVMISIAATGLLRHYMLIM